MMKGLNLGQLAAKIKSNMEAKKDFIAPAKKVCMHVREEEVGGKLVPFPTLEVFSASGEFRLNNVMHNQVGGHVDIPSKYYDRMLAEKPDLLAMNVNSWLASRPDEDKRMVRTIGPVARAFLSNRYNRIENEEIAEVALPILSEVPDIQIVSSEITDRRMYIQAVTPRIQAEVKKGDVVQAGLIISNSEVGAGSVSVAAILWRLQCLNGMTSQDRLRVYHVGRTIEDTDELWADDTKAAEDRLVLKKVRDMVRAALDETRFRQRVARCADLASASLSGDPVAAVEVLARKVGVSEKEQGGILSALIKGADLSAWGMINAVTAQAHKASSYDRAVEFENAGGELANLNTSEWRTILTAEKAEEDPENVARRERRQARQSRRRR